MPPENSYLSRARVHTMTPRAPKGPSASLLTLLGELPFIPELWAPSPSAGQGQVGPASTH